MQIFEGIEGIRAFISEEKRAGKTIGLVPTMGALHQGHLSLISKSTKETQTTIASIFVNPLQFNNAIDLEKYPRTLDTDIQLLREAGCRAVFIPAVTEIYKNPITITLNFGDLEKTLEGEFRPGHFSGVGVVVSKLFNIIQPDVAFFGQKDYQQFLIVKHIVEDLNFPIQLKCEATVREPDGLAMSSRNQRLSTSERNTAPILYNTLLQAKASLEKLSLADIKSETRITLETGGVSLEYFELANRETLQLLNEYKKSTPSILLIAAKIGDVRLIDNLFV